MKIHAGTPSAGAARETRTLAAEEAEPARITGASPGTTTAADVLVVAEAASTLNLPVEEAAATWG